MSQETGQEISPDSIRKPPVGLALLTLMGPGIMWCGEYIGSGEVILAPRTGAILGLGILWVPLVAIVTKCFIGLAGARYTVCTGEGMIDMLARTPGPKNWVIWIVFIGQVASGAIAAGALASAAGTFVSYFIPAVHPHILGWLVTAIVFALVWSGSFDPLKTIMAILVGLIVLGVFDVALATWPGWKALLAGLFGFQVPEIPDWAIAPGSTRNSPWKEILPLLGWAAGGFASQVWYTYWVLGAEYGMTRGRGYGCPLDEARLKSLNVEEAGLLKGWCRVVTVDATMAMVVGLLITMAFVIAGAGVLGPAQVAPEGPSVATELSRLFATRWGAVGGHLFVLAATAALVSTLIGQFAGWPRLLADCARILFPAVGRFSWKVQFRTVLCLFFFSNMVLVYTFGMQPVAMVKTGAIVEGLLLTPLQAVCVGLVLFRVMPRLYSKEVYEILKPPLFYVVGLGAAFLVYAYSCVFRIPEILGG